MLNRSSMKRILPILKKDARRATRMKVAGFPRPYYCSLLLRDIEWLNIFASAGSIYRTRNDHTRHVYCDLRVGNYRNDQTSNGGIEEEDEDRESNEFVDVPIDDRDLDELRHAVWRLTEAKFRESLKEYNIKETERLAGSASRSALASFTKLQPIVKTVATRKEKYNEHAWIGFCKRASRFMHTLPRLSQSTVEFEAHQETKLFVNTERSVIIQHVQVFSLTASMKRLTSDGEHIEQDYIVHCARTEELPDFKHFKRAVLEKYELLQKLSKAKKIHSFSGPVLLYPGPAGLLFHEALGHRVEGSRLLSESEGQTFRDRQGDRILPTDVTVRDNPLTEDFIGCKCIGAYRFDDEGTPAKDTVIVEHGVLKDFLSTRAALERRGFTPNGHARNRIAERPISRMSVLQIESERTVSGERLREMLLREIRRQRKTFGMIIYDASSGETGTTVHEPQAFSGEIAYATLLYADGSEVPVRGVNFVGTPLHALNNILAVGDVRALENSFCGAESGLIPISTISPAVLLSTLELQAREGSRAPRHFLPQPNKRSRSSSR